MPTPTIYLLPHIAARDHRDNPPIKSGDGDDALETVPIGQLIRRPV
jgi:hypothetical protein